MDATDVSSKSNGRSRLPFPIVALSWFPGLMGFAFCQYQASQAYVRAAMGAPSHAAGDAWEMGSGYASFRWSWFRWLSGSLADGDTQRFRPLNRPPVPLTPSRPWPHRSGQTHGRPVMRSERACTAARRSSSRTPPSAVGAASPSFQFWQAPPPPGARPNASDPVSDAGALTSPNVVHLTPF